MPASEEGGNPLTDSAAVNVVLSLLRIADHPGDTVARFHVAHSPLGAAIGLEDYRDDAAARRVSLQVRQSLVQHGYGATIQGWTQSLARHLQPPRAEPFGAIGRNGVRLQCHGHASRGRIRRLRRKRRESPIPFRRMSA